MSETQPVRITGGTFFIGFLLFIIAVNSCEIHKSLNRIENAVAPPTQQEPTP